MQIKIAEIQQPKLNQFATVLNNSLRHEVYTTYKINRIISRYKTTKRIKKNKKKILIKKKIEITCKA